MFLQLCWKRLKVCSARLIGFRWTLPFFQAAIPPIRTCNVCLVLSRNRLCTHESWITSGTSHTRRRAVFYFLRFNGDLFLKGSAFWICMFLLLSVFRLLLSVLVCLSFFTDITFHQHTKYLSCLASPTPLFFQD